MRFAILAEWGNEGPRKYVIVPTERHLFVFRSGFGTGSVHSSWGDGTQKIGDDAADDDFIVSLAEIDQIGACEDVYNWRRVIHRSILCRRRSARERKVVLHDPIWITIPITDSIFGSTPDCVGYWHSHGHCMRIFFTHRGLRSQELVCSHNMAFWHSRN